MERTTGPIGRMLDAVASLAMAIAALLLVILIVIFGWLVFGRYVLNATPTWVEQLALLIVVWIAFLGAAVGVRRKTHLSVDFIRDALKPRPRKALTVFATLALLFFGAVMAWQGYVMWERTARRERIDAGAEGERGEQHVNTRSGPDLRSQQVLNPQLETDGE